MSEGPLAYDGVESHGVLRAPDNIVDGLLRVLLEGEACGIPAGSD